MDVVDTAVLEPEFPVEDPELTFDAAAAPAVIVFFFSILIGVFVPVVVPEGGCSVDDVRS